MNIVIVGGGPVGSTLAQQLNIEQKHSITVIEKDPLICQELTNKLDILTVVGSGTDPSALIKAGLTEADIIIAVTSQEEVNILSCHLAQKLGVAQRVARLTSSYITNELYNLDELGVTDIIEPEGETVSQILQYITIPETTHIVDFKESSLSVRGYMVTKECHLLDRPAGDLAKITNNDRLQHLMIVRDGTAITPHGTTLIQEGDEVLTLMPTADLASYHSLFENRKKLLERVVISGSSSLAMKLAEEVETLAARTLLISEDEKFCRRASAYLTATKTYQGEAASEEVRSDTGTGKASFFISVDDDSEDNIMTGLLAKADGAKRAIAVTESSKHSSLFLSLGIDKIINPSTLMVKRIFSEVSGFSQGTFFRQEDTGIEMRRLTINDKNELAGISLIELRQKISAHFLVGCIFRNSEFVVARGNTIIELNDELVLFFDPANTKSITKLFKAK